MASQRLMSFGIATLAAAAALGACILTERLLNTFQLLLFVPYVQNAGASATISAFIFTNIWANEHYNLVKYRTNSMLKILYMTTVIVVLINIIEVVTTSLTFAADIIVHQACFQEISGIWNCDPAAPKNHDTNLARSFFLTPQIIASEIPLSIVLCCITGRYWAKLRNAKYITIPIVFCAFAFSSELYKAISYFMASIMGIKVPSVIEEHLKSAGIEIPSGFWPGLYRALILPFDTMSLTACISFCIGIVAYLFFKKEPKSNALQAEQGRSSA